ncbi:hypothetical protein HNR46_002593 [Haloferula luteola]|uniref:Uncharacterized protein n=1 Tax=Haloferula luteola TaxID=595692 RepID=A0A840VCH1_9BACT|nr:hypothetical protein [Haloferula luteola]MBB5352348.1 hypothetical protein [Haloferula luteola]
MKPDFVAIACCAALAIMTGAVASHFASVQQMVELAHQGKVAPPAPANSQSPDDASWQEWVARLQQQNQLLRQTLESRTAGEVPEAPILTSTGLNDDDLRRMIQTLVQQNQELQSKLAETNRDVMALEFRVDSHSEQFRPLNLSEPTEVPDSSSPLDDLREDIGVLPPMDLH